MDGSRHEIVSWDEVDRLIQHLIPQFDLQFEAMVIITRGGIIPGGMLCEALDIMDVLTAAVDFPFEAEQRSSKLLAWPRFIQFPPIEQIEDRNVIIVDDVWGSGRTITAVRERVAGAGGVPYTCVLHYNPYRSLFTPHMPDYYAAVTDAYIVYPWEVDRGTDTAPLIGPSN
jgi:hypoxanthine phosphoribosyltransferase